MNSGTSAAGSARLVLVAVILAAAMMFISQTIVTLAIPDLRKDFSPSATATQWIVNGYLLSLAALLMLGGKLPGVLATVARSFYSRVLASQRLSLSPPQRPSPERPKENP